ncbi:MAG: ABC transporter ATP-binding protein [Micrococcales bacterium]|nr:ABC transporter ATP-binding protein [Micrococcales bacterium]MCL2668493.1 ABC transporter ATP-binding protein [Micrococcales bacterium]
MNTCDDVSVAKATGLTKIYGKGEAAVHALAGVDVELGRGQLTAIMGPSGSGKSTLMHCLAGLDTPTDGSVWLAGADLGSMSDRALTAMRRTKVGFVFQAFNLVATLTAEENIVLPLQLAHAKVDQGWFDQIVDVLGLASRLKHRPSQLSGGQQQRVACARAMVTKPAVIFGDEPTGNLDTAASRDVLGFLRHSVDELGQSLVVVTHDPGTAVFADRVLFLKDGQVVDDLANPTQAAVLGALQADVDQAVR